MKKIHTRQPRILNRKTKLLLALVALLSVAMVQELNLDQPCEDCHESQDWNILRSFDHSDTRFALKGQHQFIDCTICHTGTTLIEKHAFKETSSLCEDCHFDPHDARYGFDCDRCHTANDWLDMNWRDAHDGTFFPLLGAHKLLDCFTCHRTLGANDAGIDRPDFECNSCHADRFEGVEAHEPFTTHYCEMCHNPFAWVPAQFQLHDALFQIYSGPHNGRWTDCTTECHVNANNYSDFSCGLNGVCHKHDKNRMDSQHNGKSGYAYNSHRCYSCHG